MKRTFLRLALFLGMAGSLVLSACGGGSDTPTTPPQATSAPQATATARPTTPQAPTATAIPVSRGQLRLALSGLRGQQMLPSSSGLQLFIDPMYDKMMGSSTEGSKFDPDRGFTTSYTASADAKMWTFKFRKGVKFSNGDEATSADGKFMYEYSMRTDVVVTAGSALRNSIASMETPDDTTLVVTLKNPAIFFGPSTMAPIGGSDIGMLLPKNYLEKMDLKAAQKAPIGSGPFLFKENNIGNNTVFEATANHWYFGVPRYKTLEYRLIPEESTRVALLKTGDIEVAEIGRAQEAPLAQAGLVIARKKGALTMNIRIHDQWIPKWGNEPNPLANVNVRKALDLAIDRKLLNAKFLGGKATPAVDPTTTDPKGYDPTYQPAPVPAQDIKLATQVLKDSGFAGFKLDVVIHEAQGLPEGKEIMEAIADWWTEIGVKVNRVPLAYATVLQKWFTGGGKGLDGSFDKPTITGLVGNGVNPSPTFSGGVTFVNNPGKLFNEIDIEEATLKASAASTAQEYSQLLATARRLNRERYLQIFLGLVDEVYAAKPGIGADKWNLSNWYVSININGLATGKGLS